MYDLYKLILIILFITFGTLALLSLTEEIHEEYNIVIQNHRFIPEKLVIPANTKIKLVIQNLDDSVEEFESVDLKKERLIPSHATVNTIVGPLKPGVYSFFGEFHEETAKGQIEVK